MELDMKFCSISQGVRHLLCGETARENGGKIARQDKFIYFIEFYLHRSICKTEQTDQL